MRSLESLTEVTVDREDRIEVAREAGHRFRKKVSWRVECGAERALFTHIAAPC